MFFIVLSVYNLYTEVFEDCRHLVPSLRHTRLRLLL